MDGNRENAELALDREESTPAWQTPGLQLRKARRERGLSIDDVCERLALTQRAVKALESDDYEKLPSALYIRGYIRRYCDLLEIQVEAVLSCFEAHQRAFYRRDGRDDDDAEEELKPRKVPIGLWPDSPKKWLIILGSVGLLIILFMAFI